MKLAMRVTMDALVRSLRGFVHDLADGLEHEGAALKRRLEARQAAALGLPRDREASSDERGG